jgi:hypothetical protein
MDILSNNNNESDDCSSSFVMIGDELTMPNNNKQQQLLKQTHGDISPFLIASIIDDDDGMIRWRVQNTILAKIGGVDIAKQIWEQVFSKRLFIISVFIVQFVLGVGIGLSLCADAYIWIGAPDFFWLGAPSVIIVLCFGIAEFLVCVDWVLARAILMSDTTAIFRLVMVSICSISFILGMPGNTTKYHVFISIAMCFLVVYNCIIDATSPLLREKIVKSNQVGELVLLVIWCILFNTGSLQLPILSGLTKHQAFNFYGSFTQWCFWFNVAVISQCAFVCFRLRFNTSALMSSKMPLILEENNVAWVTRDGKRFGEGNGS